MHTISTCREWSYLYVTCFHWSLTQFVPNSKSRRTARILCMVKECAIVDVEASSTDVFPANVQGAELGPNILDLCLEMMFGICQILILHSFTYRYFYVVILISCNTSYRSFSTIYGFDACQVVISGLPYCHSAKKGHLVIFAGMSELLQFALWYFASFSLRRELNIFSNKKPIWVSCDPWVVWMVEEYGLYQAARPSKSSGPSSVASPPQ